MQRFVKVFHPNCFSKTYSETKSSWPIKSSKEEIFLSCDSKELFEQRFVKVLDQNQKHVEARNQRTGTPAYFTVCGRTVRSSHRRCCIRKLFLKILQYRQETPVLESKTCNFIKKRPQHRCFPVNIAKYLILLILKDICKQLHFNFFNGSPLHGPMTNTFDKSIKFLYWLFLVVF